MTLTTHAVVGAGIVSLAVYNPTLGICAAFLSHFVIEAIPHWSYEIKSQAVQPHSGITRMSFSDKNLIRDFLIIGTDGILGLVLSIFLFSTKQNFLIVFVGACVGMLPDVLLFAYSRWPHEPLVSLQNFHEWIHSAHQAYMQHRIILGIASQIALVLAYTALVKFVL